MSGSGSSCASALTACNTYKYITDKFTYAYAHAYTCTHLYTCMCTYAHEYICTTCDMTAILLNEHCNSFMILRMYLCMSLQPAQSNHICNTAATKNKSTVTCNCYLQLLLATATCNCYLQLLLATATCNCYLHEEETIALCMYFDTCAYQQRAIWESS